MRTDTHARDQRCCTALLRQTDPALAARLLVGRAVQLRLRDVLPQRRPVGEHARRDAAHELAVRARLHERRAAVEDPVELVAVEADREEVRRRDRGRGGRARAAGRAAGAAPRLIETGPATRGAGAGGGGGGAGGAGAGARAAGAGAAAGGSSRNGGSRPGAWRKRFPVRAAA